LLINYTAMYDEHIIEFLHLSTWRIEDLSRESFKSFVDAGIDVESVYNLFQSIRKQLN
jgi:hypothetical protein